MTSARVFCHFRDIAGVESTIVVRVKEDSSIEAVIDAWAAKYDKSVPSGVGSVRSQFEIVATTAAGKTLKGSRSVADLEDVCVTVNERAWKAFTGFFVRRARTCT